MANISSSKGLTTNDPLSQTFNFDNLPIRISDQEGVIWFVANDVCAVLEINNPHQAISRLDDDEKSTIEIGSNGGQQNVNIISESGLYALVMTSRKAQAKRFKRWVTHEVLPAIRKTGSYSSHTANLPAMPAPEQDQLQLAFAMAAEVSKTIFNAVMAGGQRWRNERYLFYFVSDERLDHKKPAVHTLERDALIVSVNDKQQLDFMHAYPSCKVLVKLIKAFVDRLSQMRPLSESEIKHEVNSKKLR